MCCCCATLLLLRSSYFSRHSSPRNHLPYTTGSPTFPLCSAKLQTVPTFLHFGLLFTTICVFIKIMFPAGEGRGVCAETDGSPSSRFLAPLPVPRSLSRLLFAADLPPTPTDNLNDQKPTRKPRSTPALTLFYPRPSPTSSLAPAVC